MSFSISFALQDSVQAAQVLNQVLNQVSLNFVHCEPSYERSFELTKKISCLLKASFTALHLCNGFELLNMKCKIEKWLLDLLTGGILLAM